MVGAAAETRLPQGSRYYVPLTTNTWLEICIIEKITYSRPQQKHSYDTRSVLICGSPEAVDTGIIYMLGPEMYVQVKQRAGKHILSTWICLQYAPATKLKRIVL